MEPVGEARLEQTEYGLSPLEIGWYVVNLRDARWYHANGRGAACDPDGDKPFDQLGFSLYVLAPGEPMSMYHWEADQEDFLVVAGEAVLVIEGEERPLRAWDFVHCPPGASHVIVGAGSEPCFVIAVGARDRSVDKETWGAYPVDETAARYGASVDEETNRPSVAYAKVGERAPARFREEWLPR